ncbi:MAG TPA: hypothetical protein VD883_00360 [Candidatus Omnitrophota bacterium]|nr:hypothetical protein [Candidatus Omnitrophota bacterium]
MDHYLSEARLGKWTEDYGRLLANYKKVMELDPQNREAAEEISAARDFLRPALKPQFAFYGDSEGLSIDSYGTSFEFYPSASTKLNFQYGYHRFSQDGRSADKNSFSGKINHRISSQLSGGLFYEYNDYDGAPDSQTFQGDLYYQVTGSTGLYFAYSRHNLLDVEDPFSIYGWNIIGDIDAIFEDIHTNDYTATVIHRFSDRLRYLGSFTFGDYSDGNEKKTAFNELDWIFWKPQTAEETEWHLKYSYFLLDYSDDSPFYWSPNFFDNHSLILQVKGNISRKLFFMVESGVSISPDSSGLGYRGVAKLEYRINKDWSVEGSAFYFSEEQEERDSYWARKFTAAIKCRF